MEAYRKRSFPMYVAYVPRKQCKFVGFQSLAYI